MNSRTERDRKILESLRSIGISKKESLKILEVLKRYRRPRPSRRLKLVYSRV